MTREDLSIGFKAHMKKGLYDGLKLSATAAIFFVGVAGLAWIGSKLSNDKCGDCGGYYIHPDDE